VRGAATHDAIATIPSRDSNIVARMLYMRLESRISFKQEEVAT